MQSNWHTDFLNNAYFSDLSEMFELCQLKSWPSADCLNKLARAKGLTQIQFSEDAEDPRYYEQIIFEDKRVPTRRNWHDFFNACIWMLFPRLKLQLNKIHIDEISQFGLHPRTPKRNRVTHFDECGGILAYESEGHLKALQEQRWHEAFCNQAPLWGNSTRLFQVGHANYEMLLSPFIGLTGKYLPIQVTSSFWHLSLLEQYAHLEQSTLNLIESDDVFATKGWLKPIPMLGIPGWWQKQDADFYGNTNYFCPLKTKK